MFLSALFSSTNHLSFWRRILHPIRTHGYERRPTFKSWNQTSWFCGTAAMIQAASANSKLLLAAVKAKVILWGLLPPEMHRKLLPTHPSQWPHHFSFIPVGPPMCFLGPTHVEPNPLGSLQRSPKKSLVTEVTGHPGRKLQRQAMISAGVFFDPRISPLVLPSSFHMTTQKGRKQQKYPKQH